MSEDKKITREAICKLLAFITDEIMQLVQESPDPPTTVSTVAVDNVLTHVAFDLSTVILLVKGRFDEAQARCAEFPDVGSLLVELDPKAGEEVLGRPSKAVWPPINAPGNDPDEPDPSAWN
jgi:hypothetical protein